MFEPNLVKITRIEDASKDPPQFYDGTFSIETESPQGMILTGCELWEVVQYVVSRAGVPEGIE